MTFWFDPACPFAWMASRWIHEVAAQRPVDVTWKVMSLAVLNEGNEVPDQDRAATVAAWKGTRLAVAVGQQYDNETLGRLYTALGTRIHNGHRSLDDAVRAAHVAGQEAAGDKVGTPVVAIDGRAFFGPVVTPIPRGADALQFLDALRSLYGVPQFAELKRARNGPPDFS